MSHHVAGPYGLHCTHRLFHLELKIFFIVKTDTLVCIYLQETGVQSHIKIGTSMISRLSAC